MTQKFIRYADIAHTDNLYLDYYYSGMLEDRLEISEKGRCDAIKYAHTIAKNDINTIYFSPSIACKQTAVILGSILNVEIAELPILQNLKHDFRKLTDKKLWTELGPNPETLKLLRKEFFTQLNSNLLYESKAQLGTRLDSIYQFSIQNQSSIYITHGIILKLLELYMANNCSFIQFEKRLVDRDFDTPFFSALKGFELIS